MKEVINITIWIKLLAFISMIGVPIIAVFRSDWFSLMRSGQIDTMINENIFFILSITLLIMSIQNIFTVIPLMLVLTINYTLFGFLYGFLWSWFSSIIAATFMFFGSRYFFQGWVVRKIKQEWLTKIENNAFIFVFQARVMPFVPTSLINILGGVSPIKFTPFILGTILGNFIYFFILISIPAGILNADLNDYIVVSVILLAIVVYITLKNINKRKKAKKNIDSDYT